MPATLILYNRHLRLSQNPALCEAVKTKAPLIHLYLDSDEVDGRPIGCNQRWWLAESLKALDARLREEGHHLTLFKGTIEKAIQEFSPSQVFWNRLYEPEAVKFQKKLTELLKNQKIPYTTFPSYLLFEPWSITNKSGQFYKVYTQFMKTATKDLDLPAPLRKPVLKNCPAAKTASEKLPTAPKELDFSDDWTPGEEGARNRLQKFLSNGLADYKTQRDIPPVDGTSMLSPYLHFGEITPAQIWRAVEEHETPKNKPSVECYQKELVWREFSYHLLYHFPKLETDPFVDKFSHFPWSGSSKQLEAWQQGKTGYPIVDAGMRQLLQTGWMHNRVRMIVASFLTKDLFIHWRRGEEWFWEHLLDADRANNSASWQWTAGSGADAAPYFRVFNPITQGEKFDPEGEYIRAFVPELADLPASAIHAPWKASDADLRAAGIELGKTYPKPMVDHSEQREEALRRFAELKKFA